MITSQNSISITDFIADVFQLSAQGRFPGKVDLSRRALPLVESLIPLWFDDIKEARTFRILNDEVVKLKDGDYVTFSCNIPIRRRQLSGGHPIAKELEIVDESFARDLGRRIENGLPSQARRILMRELDLQKDALAQERNRLDHEREMQTDEFRRLQQALEQRTASLEQRETELDTKDANLRQVQNRYAPFLEDSRSQREDPDCVPPSSVEHLYSEWPSMLRSAGHITSNSEFPERSFLLSLLCVSLTGGLVILDGSVGIGKTSIIGRSAKILTGLDDCFTLVPVRPGWIDSTDLVGFYDPNHREYQPSPFLTALNQAKDLPNRLHFICLDELNLARIENYGADLLSCMEHRDVHRIPLYSQDIQDSLKSELISLASTNEDDLSPERNTRGKRIVQTLGLFPGQFRVPDNAIVLGTLNSDETTYDISPKVIDRSFVVQMPLADFSQPKKATHGDTQTCVIDLANIGEVIQANLFRTEDLEWFEKRLEEMQQPLKELGIPLGHRIWRDLRMFSAVARAVGLGSKETIYQHFLLLKILSRIRCRRSARTERAWQDFEMLVGRFMTDELIGALENLRRQWSDTSVYSIRYFGTVQ